MTMRVILFSTGSGSKFSLDDENFPVYLDLHNITDLNISIWRQDCKGLFIHKITQSLLIRMTHFNPLRFFSLWSKNILQRQHLLHHTERHFFLSLLPSSSFSLHHLPILNAIFVQEMDILIVQKCNFNNDFQLKLWISNYLGSTKSIKLTYLKTYD